ncbi:NAD(P)/FAD-dependent oxidoreductase [Nocardioides sp. LS1]|uniref:flavin-containing monooxygenase n=1 Tax=Nocardioides sp. LS1 TaxID=1027620 RepID=UPI000F61D977|nr:NAD(P)/FAD-dependent oxidoreductase [Nocardioides sp. LS1]GCD88123.1 putative (cyclohexanone) monooxygenase [Nocardioides sp. LS1]
MADHDVIVIGAGFAGLYQLHLLRQRGFDVLVIEAGEDVGGTWYWNRYPGARCDIESIEYSYSFDEDLQQEWIWSERYAAQPELLSYARHVADRFDLRRNIAFGARVEALDWDETSRHWTVRTSNGHVRTATYVVAATGCLSVPSRPDLAGLDDFGGELLWTSSWPDDAGLAGKRVAVVGTGSSGLQTITAIAPVVGSLTVFQRTACYAVPAHNGPIGDALSAVKARYTDRRAASRMTPSGYQCPLETTNLAEISATELPAVLDKHWEVGGLCFTDAFADVLVDPDENERVSTWVRERIRAKVDDPAVAAKLLPTFPIATKRLCVDTGYYEVYNQDNVELVDITAEPIERITERGILAGTREHELDVIIMATGFDAMTGALTAMDVRSGDLTLREKWEDGPRTYLGLMSGGFPNLFTVCGPQSPSVLSNMLTSIEYHVGWIANLLSHLRARGLARVEPLPENEDNWVRATNDLADLTLMPQAASWYMGANIPGKQRVFMPFVGGVGMYKQVADGVAAAGYHGFELT